jgi:hypothetical protein
VELSDKRVGKVVDASAHSFAKPVVSVLTDVAGSALSKDRIVQVDLSTNTDVYITRALPSEHLKGVDIMDGF